MLAGSYESDQKKPAASSSVDAAGESRVEDYDRVIERAASAPHVSSNSNEGSAIVLASENASQKILGGSLGRRRRGVGASSKLARGRPQSAPMKRRIGAGKRLSKSRRGRVKNAVMGRGADIQSRPQSGKRNHLRQRPGSAQIDIRLCVRRSPC